MTMIPKSASTSATSFDKNNSSASVPEKRFSVRDNGMGSNGNKHNDKNPLSKSLDDLRSVLGRISEDNQVVKNKSNNDLSAKVGKNNVPEKNEESNTDLKSTLASLLKKAEDSKLVKKEDLEPSPKENPDSAPGTENIFRPRSVMDTEEVDHKEKNFAASASMVKSNSQADDPLSLKKIEKQLRQPHNERSPFSS